MITVRKEGDRYIMRIDEPVFSREYYQDIIDRFTERMKDHES